MPSRVRTIEDRSYVYGMNSVDDPKALRPGECVELINAFPGYPPRLRNGCFGEIVDGLSGDSFLHPAVFVNCGGVDRVLAWVRIGDTATIKLCSFDPNGLNSGSADLFTDYVELIHHTAPDAKLGFQVVGSTVYAFVRSENYSTANYAIEFSATDYAVRKMNIDSYVIPALSELPSAQGVFSAGDVFEYSFTLVRRTDAAAFETSGANSNVILPPDILGDPLQISTFHPGVCESTEIVANRQTVIITAATASVLIDLTNYNTAGITEGATHIRVWRTRAGTSVSEVEGATKFFVTDLPLEDQLQYVDNTSDSTLAGELNQLASYDYTSAPDAYCSEFVKNRLWLLAENGVAYFSEIPGGDGKSSKTLAQEYPDKWATMFKAIDYRVDLDSQDGSDATGIRRMGDDLYFFKESKVFVLIGGDPTIAPATVISDMVGCPFPQTITSIDMKDSYGKAILFLSNDGPMIITEGGHLRAFTEFKVKELWPEHSDELFGDLVSQKDHIRQNCFAEFHENVWWVFYKTYSGIYRMFGYYLNPEASRSESAPRGAFEVKVESDLYEGLALLPVSSSRAIMLGSYGSDLVIIDFLKTDLATDRRDGPVSYTVIKPSFKIVSRPLFPGRSEKDFYELFTLVGYCSFNDDEESDNTFTVLVESERHKGERSYGNDSSVLISNQLGSAISGSLSLSHVFARSSGTWSGLLTGWKACFYNSSTPNDVTWLNVVSNSATQINVDGDIPVGTDRVRLIALPLIRTNIEFTPEADFGGTYFQYTLTKKIPLDGFFKWYGVEIQCIPRPSIGFDNLTGGMPVKNVWE